MRAVVFAVLALIGFTIQSLAAPAITLKPNSGPPGTEVTVDGTGFGGGHIVDILFDGSSLGTVTADATGAFSGKKVTIPTDAQPGKHVVMASDTVTLNFATKNFTVDSTFRQFHGNDATHTGVNPTENTIDAATAHSLMLAWAKKIGQYGATHTPVVGDGKVWIGGRDGKLYAFDDMTGAPANGFPVQVGNSDYFDRGAPIVTPQGVFIGGEQGWLYGFDPKNGNTLPSFPIHLSSYYFGSLSYANGRLYVGTFDGKLAGFQASTGMPLPHFPMQLDGGLYGALTVDNAGHGFIGTSAGSFFGINLSDATTLWKFPAGSVVTSTAAYSQGQLFFGSDSGNVFGLDAATGAPLPGSPYVTGGPVGSSPAVLGNTVCVGSFDKTINCFSRKKLARLFRRLTRSESWSSFQIANGLLIASDSTTVYVYDINTGKRLWQHAVKIGETSSPIVVNGVLFVASTDGFLRAYTVPHPVNGRNAAR